MRTIHLNFEVIVQDADDGGVRVGVGDGGEFVEFSTNPLDALLEIGRHINKAVKSLQWRKGDQLPDQLPPRPPDTDN